MLDSGAKHNRTLLSTMSAHSCRIGGSMWKAYLYGEKIGIEREHDGAMNECQRQRLHRHCRQRQGTRERDQQRAARWYVIAVGVNGIELSPFFTRARGSNLK